MSENLQYFRAIYNFLPSEKERKIVLITGARQTGKTTLAKNKYNTLRYINLDSWKYGTVFRRLRPHKGDNFDFIL